MVRDNQDNNVDAEMLRDKGFLVYNCAENTVNEMVDEIQPNVIFMNPEDSEGSTSLDLYNSILGNIYYASYPLIYTMAEDDIYLVNGSRTSKKNKRTVISDNIVDSIKVALLGTGTPGRESLVIDKKVSMQYHHARRA